MFKDFFLAVKESNFINLTFRNNITAEFNISVFIQNFLLCSNMLPFFIVKHIPTGSLYLFLLQNLSFTVNQMNMVICFLFIMMQSSRTLHSISASKLFCKQL